MPISTEQEEMQECATTFKENATSLREAAKQSKNKKVKDRLESVASSFAVNAKILEAYARSKEPEVDKYQKLFPNLQKD